MDDILTMTGIVKGFPGVRALSGVDFSIRRGEVHALIGENGAGKSTLMKVLMGIYREDEGEIVYKGQPFRAQNTRHAQECGISMIYQELNLIPDLTVAENIFVSREPRKRKLLIDDKRMIKQTRDLLTSLKLDFEPTRRVKTLSVAERQMVEIAKALSVKADILILDEPTSALADSEVQRLFEILRDLRASGVAIIYISHRLEEFDQIVDRVTVLRDGKYIATHDWANITIPELITLMVGRSITEQYPTRNAHIGDVVLEARGFCNRKLKNASLSVRSGEVLGMAGMMGAGRTEFARAIFGADRIRQGELYLSGKRISVKSPLEAIRHNIAYLPEDRRKDGLMLGLSVDDNILSASLNRCARRGVVRNALCADVTRKQIKQLQIKTPSGRQKVKFLSGGNQQKVLVGRWLCLDNKVVLFDEPTRGIDVGAKFEIFSIINRMAEAGAAVIMISSEMSEILGMSDRILVMCEGKVAGEIDASEATQELILKMASNLAGDKMEGAK